MSETNLENYECEWCEYITYKPHDKLKELNKFEYYLSPFDIEPYIVNLCDECIRELDNISQCEVCNRHISNSSGYRINIRYGYKFGKQVYDLICVKCLQDLWFKYGMESFKHADFFNYKDLSNNGFIEHGSYFCRSTSSYSEVERVFNNLKESNLVIVNIKSSGHIEHHISLYIKPINEKETDKKC